MESEILEIEWQKLNYEGVSEYVFNRIDSICIPELNIALNSLSERCLILELPKGFIPDFQSITRQNLTIEYFRDIHYIALRLTDDTYNDLFNDLVISLYQSIKDVSDESQSSFVFIQTFHKWSEFFQDGQSDKLSKDVIKGLFGELLVLKHLVSESCSANVNDILDSWKGPYDQGHDFVLDAKDIEVKTKDINKTSIRISSEQQLDNVIGKGLELLVVSVESNMVNGYSVADLIKEIKALVFNRLGDYQILLKAVRQKGLTTKNIEDYNNYRFVLINHYTYDCVLEGFPKLTKGSLPIGVNQVNYDVQLGCITKFLIKYEGVRWS